MKSTTLSSPAHTRYLRFAVHSSDCVEIIETRIFNGQATSHTERWLPEPEAANYRAELIHAGWREAHGDCGR
jgi:hypothetical protein